MKIAAIGRNPINSPQMTGNDAAILHGTADELRQLGAEVDIFDDGDEFVAENYDALFHMSRTESTLQQLQRIEEIIPVTNTTDAVRRCSRKEQVTLLEGAGIRQPFFSFLNTDSKETHTGFPVWLKKSSGWSCHADDVCHARNEKELECAMNSFRRRGIEEVLCCKHIDGDVVKFYGVGNIFFHYSYPDPEKTKFGLEKINGPTQNHPFDAEHLKQLAFAAAKSIGVEIFGGDCIINPDGNIYIIDINDFPAFSCCRTKAAKAIAKLIYSKAKP